MELISNLLSQIFIYEKVSEQFYNIKFYPLDKDHDRKIWNLKSTDGHLIKANVLYHHMAT